VAVKNGYGIKDDLAYIEEQAGGWSGPDNVSTRKKRQYARWQLGSGTITRSAVVADIMRAGSTGYGFEKG